MLGFAGHQADLDNMALKRQADAVPYLNKRENVIGCC